LNGLPELERDKGPFGSLRAAFSFALVALVEPIMPLDFGISMGHPRKAGEDIAMWK